MKKVLFTILKVAGSLSIGVFLIWFASRNLTEADKDQIYQAFIDADYTWIVFSLVFAWASHLSRAYRWKYTLEPLGLKPRFWSSYHAVMVGYLINLAVPRLGEVTRCASLARTENMSFGKLMGTVIAERVADLILLLTLTTLVVIMQLDILRQAVVQIMGPLGEKIVDAKFLMIVGIVGLIAAFFAFRFIQKATHPFLVKIREFAVGLLDGIKSIITMEKKWHFLFHTIFIWVMYVAMFYICFFSLPEIDEVPFWGVLAAFVLGGFSIIAAPGGLGAYPLAIQIILAFYMIPEPLGLAFGWIVWVAQTLLMIVLGLISFVLVSTVVKPIVGENDAVEPITVAE